MHVLETISALRAYRRGLVGDVGVVPTMGYLHEGHLSLVKEARRENAHVLATIFVNPTQFSPTEDLSAYPRDIPRDLALLEQAGVDAVFLPTPAMMYPPHYQTYILVEGVSQGKEGVSRPTHFRGVATVVTKLFHLTDPTRAYFGQKDAQQVVVIRQMVRDLNFGLEVVVCPIVREQDGLAMSSRNVYLTPTERSAARILSQALHQAGELYESGERTPEALRRGVLDVLNYEPLAQVDYVSVSRASDMQELTTPTDKPLLVSIAVKIGKPRLLDNFLLPMSLNTRHGASATLGITGEELPDNGQ